MHLKPLPVESHVAQRLEPAGVYDRNAILPVAREVGQRHPAIAADVQFLAPQRRQSHEAGQRPGLDDVNLGGGKTEVERLESAF